MLNDDAFVTIGKVLRPHGLAGFVKVFPATDDPDRFRLLKSVELRFENGNISRFEIEKLQKQKQIILLKFKNIDSREAAEKLREADIVIRRRECLALEDDAYYIFDLIGAKVETTDGKFIGILEDVLKYSAQDVYVVKNGEKEALIPAVAQIVKQIDIQAGRIVIDVIEGLLPA